MRFRQYLPAALLVAATACSSQANPPAGGADKAAAPAASAAAAPGGLASDDQKTFYALGLAMAQNLSVFNLSAEELDLVKKGLSDGVNKKEPQVKLEEWGPKIQPLAMKRTAAAAEVEKKESEKFLADEGAKKGAVKTESGLIYTEVTPGTGPMPMPTDEVKVHYKGTLRDGTEFDSSYSRNEPASFRLNGVIPCWTEGVAKMKQGGKARLVCPASIAYGDRGAPPKIKPGATLVFEVELLEVKKGEAPAAAPGAAPAAAPAKK